MKIHNLMEDIVLDKLHEIFDEEEQLGAKGYCTCYQCRLDVACFVLNRIPNKYVTSSRGLAHLRSEYQTNLQKSADLVSMIHDGIKQVSTTRRPNCDHSEQEKSPVPIGPHFNFPTVLGRLLNGTTFEPVYGVNVHLKSDGNPVEMIESSWQNPYMMVDKTAGTFLFWPHPIKANSPRGKKTFEFEIEVNEKGYEEVHHFFEMEVTAESSFNDSFHLQRTYKIEDLYLFSI